MLVCFEEWECVLLIFICRLDAISGPHFNSGALKTLCSSRNPAKKTIFGEMLLLDLKIDLMLVNSIS